MNLGLFRANWPRSAVSATLVVALTGGAACGQPANLTAASRTVEVMDMASGKPQPCPQLSGAPSAFLREGCTIDATARDAVTMGILTALGGVTVATCDVSYSLQIDAAGRVMVFDVRSEGDSPCTDIRSCFPGDDTAGTAGHPWAGRVVATRRDQFRLVADTCLDTCFGRFRGALRLNLHIDGTRWRATTGGTTVGLSGWQFGRASWDWKRRDDAGRSPADTNIAIRTVADASDQRK